MSKFIFRHTKPTELEFTFRLKSGGRGKVAFVGARSARDSKGLYGTYKTNSVEIAKNIINTKEFLMQKVVMSAHENDVKFVKKTLGIDIDDKTRTVHTQVQDLKLKKEVDRLTTENSELQASLEECEAEVTKLKGQIAGAAKGEVIGEDAEPKAENGTNETAGQPDVDENQGEPVGSEDNGFSQEEIESLKGMDIDSITNFQQLKAVANVYKIDECATAADYRSRLSELKAKL